MQATACVAVAACTSAASAFRRQGSWCSKLLLLVLLLPLLCCGCLQQLPVAVLMSCTDY
jgi:hypothetical protein